jgi:hypothetical protein
MDPELHVPRRQREAAAVVSAGHVERIGVADSACAEVARSADETMEGLVISGLAAPAACDDEQHQEGTERDSLDTAVQHVGEPMPRRCEPGLRLLGAVRANPLEDREALLLDEQS